MTVLGAALGVLVVALVGRWLLLGGDDAAPYSSRRRR
jgi:hypothetical protein